MQKIIVACMLTVVMLSTIANLKAQQGYTPAPDNLAYREAFRDMKYGLFVHWGIYSLLGDGEWVMYQQKIPYTKYSALANAFYPHAYNAEAWAKMAKDAGMKYICITSRHHDGFSMFDTKATNYDIVDATPYKKDVLAALAEACKIHGLKLHFYYSLLDWGRSDYGFGKPIVDGRPENTDWDSYIRFMKTQLTELLTNYGDVVGAIWFDGDWERKKANWHYDEIYGLIHQLRPDVLVGNNHHENIKPGEDFQLFEKDLPGQNSHGWGGGDTNHDLPLETCETINGSWGYNINDNRYKTVEQIIHYLVKAASQNTNFLLNVGPRADGTIQPEFADTLRTVGKWLQAYGESIYGTRGGIVPLQSWGGVSTKGKDMYVHILSYPADDFVFLPGLKIGKHSAAVWPGGQACRTVQVAEGLFVYPNYPAHHTVDHVIKISEK